MRRGDAERGFTLVEMIVVMIIMTVLMAMILTTFRGTKKATFVKAAEATAFAYQQGIDAYMSDNGQRAPIVGDPQQWPDEDRGPVNPQFSRKPYMRVTPEHVSGGMVDFKTPKEPVDAHANAVVEYSIDPTNPGLYTLDVWVLQGDVSKKYLECVVTNRGQLKPGEKRCVS